MTTGAPSSDSKIAALLEWWKADVYEPRQSRPVLAKTVVPKTRD